MYKISIVSPDKIRWYFTGKDWASDTIGNIFEATNKSTGESVKIEVVKTLFHVEIEMIDDPIDSDSFYTYEPIKDIIKFIKSNVPHADLLESSLGPELIASMLRRLSSLIEYDKLKISKISRTLKFIVSSLSSDNFSTIEEDWIGSELSLLKKKMKNKNWVVKETNSKSGLPQLEVEILNICKAVITVPELIYNCTFSVVGYDNSIEDVETDDPIRSYKTYVSNEEILNILSDYKAKKQTIRAPT